MSATELDLTRLRNAINRLASSLNVRLDQTRPDHELLERIVNACITSLPHLPDPKHVLECGCPACARAGDA